MEVPNFSGNILTLLIKCSILYIVATTIILVTVSACLVVNAPTRARSR